VRVIFGPRLWSKAQPQQVRSLACAEPRFERLSDESGAKDARTPDASRRRSAV